MVNKSIIAEWLRQFRQSENFQPLADRELVAFVVEQILCNKHESLEKAMPHILERLISVPRVFEELGRDCARLNKHYNEMSSVVEESGTPGGLFGLNKMQGIAMGAGFTGNTFFSAVLSEVVEWVEGEFEDIRSIANLQFGAAA